jgi:hypothetical protein
MFKASEEQIQLLVRVLESTESAKSVSFANLISEGESLEFYLGLISGLVLSHQLLVASNCEDKTLAQLLSIAAARASEQYMKLKSTGEIFFPELIEVD